MGVYLERYGRGEKILFLHGAGGSTASWSFQKGLQTVAEVVLVDLPGHGKSGGEGFAAHRGLRRKRPAGDHGKRPGGMLCGGPFDGRRHRNLFGPRRTGAARRARPGGNGGKAEGVPTMLEGILSDKEETVRAIVGFAFSKKAPPGLVEAGFAEMMASPKEVLHDDFSACNMVDLMEDVKSISLPTLIIAGADDAPYPLEISEYLNREIRGSTAHGHP